MTSKRKCYINIRSQDGGGNGYFKHTYAITLQTAGNRSMLANDFTQVNDSGYGTVAINTALSEL